MFVCYYRTLILICTVLFYFSFLNHVYSALQLLVLDFLHAFRCFNIQSAPPASQFWTSSVPSAALTSNSLLRLPGFGLHPCLTLLQRPILSSGFPVLDFIRASLRFNVQLSLPDSHRFFNCFHQPTITMLTSFNYPPLWHPRLHKLSAAGRTNAIHWDFT